MALGPTEPLVKMSNRNIPGGKRGRRVRLTTSPPSCAECHENLGAYTSWNGREHLNIENFMFRGVCMELNWNDVLTASLSMEWRTTDWVVWGNNEEYRARFDYCNIEISGNEHQIYMYICRTAALTSRHYILNIYSTNIHTEYFKHAA